MKIIFNSDLLYADSFIKENLHSQLRKFLISCKKSGHEIVIPLTTLLEFNNKQSEFAKKEIKELDSAVAKLVSYSIKIDSLNTSELVKSPDLIRLIGIHEIKCTVEKPTKEDYDNAHHRACFKVSPAFPDAKSDEMRDLIIWEISLRIANNNNGAILMSRDKVHTNCSGDKEASECRLIRCNSFERGYESLSIDTVSAIVIKELITKMWPEIIKSDLPIVKGGQIVSIKEPEFIETEKGSTTAVCIASFQTGDGKELVSLMNIEYMNELPFIIEFKEIEVRSKKNKSSHKDVKLNFKEPVISNKDLIDRMGKLRNILKR